MAALGNDEWKFTDCLPYFRKMETDVDISDDFHGNTDPSPSAPPAGRLAAGAGRVLERLPRRRPSPRSDMNHPDSGGVGPVPMNNPTAWRMSTSITYLREARHRLNLTIRPNVTCRRILFEGKKAVGVEVESGGEVSR